MYNFILVYISTIYNEISNIIFCLFPYYFFNLE